jgi:hypothetical protein
MLFKEIIAVYSENHAKRIQNSASLILKQMVHTIHIVVVIAKFPLKKLIVGHLVKAFDPVWNWIVHYRVDRSPSLLSVLSRECSPHHSVLFL